VIRTEGRVDRSCHNAGEIIARGLAPVRISALKCVPLSIRCKLRVRSTEGEATNPRTMASSSSSSSPLKFSSFSSQVDPSFWFTLSTLKLNTWKLDSSPQRTNGVYSTPLRQTPMRDGIIELNGGAFDESMYLSTLN
jgi:hypothetical protein